MEGKICLITGATSGIGRETALGLTRLGARVILVGRDEARTRETASWLKTHTGKDPLGAEVAELSRMSEVEALARRVRAQHERLNVLVNNAGGCFPRRKVTPEGFEYTWALCHLAYAKLTLALLSLLREGGPARIVNVASGFHTQGKISFEDLQGEKHYRMMAAYTQAKLANVLFTYALARRLKETRVTVNCLHPGFVKTGMGRELTGVQAFLQNVLLSPFQISPEKGARTSIYLASSAEVDGKSSYYFEKCRAVPSSPASYDVELQERLFAVTLDHLRGLSSPGGPSEDFFMPPEQGEDLSAPKRL